MRLHVSMPRATYAQAIILALVLLGIAGLMRATHGHPGHLGLGS